MKLIIDDGFRADLVKDAFFEGAMEIPIIKKPEKITFPLPFEKLLTHSFCNLKPK